MDIAGKEEVDTVAVAVAEGTRSLLAIFGAERAVDGALGPSPHDIASLCSDGVSFFSLFVSAQCALCPLTARTLPNAFPQHEHRGLASFGWATGRGLATFRLVATEGALPLVVEEDAVDRWKCPLVAVCFSFFGDGIIPSVE